MTATSTVLNGRQDPASSVVRLRGRAVLGWKVLEYVGLAAFTLLVPRLMGPEQFGRFAGVLSLVGLATVITGLGAQATFGRFVPEYEATGRRDATVRLFTQLLIARLIVATLLGLGVLVGVPALLPETSAVTAAFAAAAVVTGAVALTCFQLCYGLNRLDRWLVRDGLARLVVTVALLAGGLYRSVEGAVMVIWLVEVGFLVLGLSWARPYVMFAPPAAALKGIAAPLRFGLLFFSAGALLLVVWRGGELTVMLLSDARAEIGFFNIASAVGMALAAVLGQLGGMVVPSAAAFQVTGQVERLDRWLGLSLRYLTVAAVAAVVVVTATADAVVPLLLGDAYARVAPNLRVLALGLVPLVLVRTAVTLAMVHKAPQAALRIGLAAVGAFVAAAFALVPVFGSGGASAAVTLAFGVGALVALNTDRLGAVLRRARYWEVLTPAAPLAVLAVLPAGGPIGVLAAAALYAAVVGMRGVLGMDDWRRMGRLLAADAPAGPAGSTTA